AQNLPRQPLNGLVVIGGHRGSHFVVLEVRMGQPPAGIPHRSQWLGVTNLCPNAQGLMSVIASLPSLRQHLDGAMRDECGPGAPVTVVNASPVALFVVGTQPKNALTVTHHSP